MKNVFGNINLTISVALLLLILGCSCTNKNELYLKDAFKEAVVIKYEVDACGYILALDSKEHLMPKTQLSEEFKKDKLKVWIKYTVQKRGMNTTCMAGQLVDVVEIKKR